MMDPDLLTKLIFNDTVIVECSSDYENSIMIEISKKGDQEQDKRTFHLEPDEVDLFIAALNLYKNRIIGKNID